MRVVAIIAGLVTVFFVALATLIAAAIAIGAVIHACVSEIDVGTATLIVLLSGLTLGCLVAYVIKLVAQVIRSQFQPNDDVDESDIEDQEETAEDFADRIADSLISRMELVSPYANAQRRRKKAKK